jgi:hypothetical protein
MSIKIGTNIRRDGSDSVELIRRSEAMLARFVPLLEQDLTRYLLDLVANEIEPVAVLAKESFGLGADLDWGLVASALKEYRHRYGSLVTYWQVGNEWDMESESSWTMHSSDLVELGHRARKAFGSEAYLIVGGAADGAPGDEPEERLSELDLTWADAVAIHTYGQGVPGWTRDDGMSVLPFSPYGWKSTVRGLIDGYKAEAPNHDLWITEHGFRWDELGEGLAAQYAEAYLSYLVHRCPDVYAFTQFALTDAQVPGFGLYTSEGHAHHAAANFSRYAALARAKDPVVPVPVPVPPMTVDEAIDAAYRDLFLAGGAAAEAVYGPDLGIVKFWREHVAELGSAVGPEHLADDGTVVQAFALGLVKWDPTNGASKVA